IGPPVDDAVGRGGFHPTQAVVGPRVPRVPGDDRAVLGEGHQLQVHRRHRVVTAACGYDSVVEEATSEEGGGGSYASPAQEIPPREVTARHGPDPGIADGQRLRSRDACEKLPSVPLAALSACSRRIARAARCGSMMHARSVLLWTISS